MSRREELEREIRDLQGIIEQLKNDVYKCEDNVKHYQTLLDVKNNEFRDEYYAAENDYVRDTSFGASGTDIVNEGYELRYKLQDIKAQYDDEARVLISNLNSAKEDLRNTESDLHDARQKLQKYQNELHNLQVRSRTEQSYYENYDEQPQQPIYPTDEYKEEKSYDYAPTVNKPNKPNLKLQSNRLSTKVQTQNDMFDLHRIGLREYAKTSQKEYKELKAVTGGYRAAVGNTIFDYRNPDDLVVKATKGLPTIDDFKTILKIEKKTGRISLPIGNITNKEYMARLIVGAFEAGLTPSGQIHISEKDLVKLNTDTRKKYHTYMQIYEMRLAQQRNLIKKAISK
ncbi:MAG: hypothetical protein IJX20_04330 [Alphaproteobacteria bacterium]|nr:hypothetical protein [Alphaproteobacteria bacterium]